MSIFINMRQFILSHSVFRLLTHKLYPFIEIKTCVNKEDKHNIEEIDTCQAVCLN